MKRLWGFLALLLAITFAFTFMMRGLAPYPIDVVLGFAAAFLVIFAGSSFREAHATARDLRLVRAGSAPSPAGDRKRIAIAGKLKAQGLPLRAPFTRRECVYYRYAAADEEMQGASGKPVPSEYSGLAMTRCLVRDRLLEIRLVGVPMFEGFENHALTIPPGDCGENAERYVRETRFETLSTSDPEAVMRSMRTTFDDRDGQVRRDVRLETSGSIGEMTLQETIVPVDEEVCVVGTWSTEQAGVVQLLGTRELLTVYAGGADGAVARLSATMRRHLLGGGVATGLVLMLVIWKIAAS